MGNTNEINGARPLILPPAGNQTGVIVSKNEELLTAGLRLLREPLSLYVCEEIKRTYGEAWWTEGVLQALVYKDLPTVEDVMKYRRLPMQEASSIEECATSLEVSVCLLLLTKHWPRIFKALLSKDHRDWAYELIRVRNMISHPRGDAPENDLAWRNLDTMYRLILPIDGLTATSLLEVRSSVDLAIYGQAGFEPTKATATGTSAASGQSRRVSESETVREEKELDDDLAAAGLDFSEADLRNMDFANANLEGADFEGADLTGANLKGARLVGANFKGANLSDANLTTADLAGAHFEGTALSAYFDKERGPYSKAHSHGADLTGATLDNATLNFADCDLRSVNFGAVNLEGANFEGADLTGANLKGARLVGANFKGANLSDANLTTADLAGAHFEGTALSAYFDKERGPYSKAHSHGADLTGATLDNATLNFADCDLRSVNFGAVNLEGANFEGADLTGANLKGAVLRRVNLRNAKIKDANTTDVQWT